MTRDETKKILMVMQASFPNYHPVDPAATLNTWELMLQEYTYEQMSMALKAYILADTTGFAPSIGQLVEKVSVICATNELNELEAWALVSKALRNGYYGAEKEFEKLPELVQKAVGQPSQLRQWAQTDSESVENVIQSNFLRTYRAVLKREHDVSKMPRVIRDMISSNSPKREEIEVGDGSLIEQQDIYKGCVPMPERVRERMKNLFGEA